MYCLRKCLLSALFVAALVAARPVSAQFEAVVRWVPESANGIVLIQAERILNSDLAKKDDWKKKRKAAFSSGASNLPSTTKLLVTAVQMDMQFMQPIWTVSVFSNQFNELSIGDISKRSGGNIENIAGLEAIALSNDSYIVKVEDKVLAAMSPANRQATSRWLESRQGQVMNVSPYLTDAVRFADKNADVIVAFDLHDVMDASEIRKRVKDTDIFEDADIDGVVDLLTSIKGITLGVTVTDSIFGSIKVDFANEATALKKNGQKLLMHALDNHGLTIDDFNSWKFSEKGNQLLLSGPLTDYGFKQVLTVIRDPIHADIHNTNKGTVEVSMATKSKQYFSAIQKINQDRQKKHAKAMNTYATWFEKDARDIDQLSILKVDEEMVQYGQYVSDSYRDIAGGLRNTKLQETAVRSTMGDSFSYGSYSVGGGYGGGYGARYGRHGSYGYRQDNSAARRAVGTQAKAKGEAQARDILREIQTKTEAIRIKMTQKYQIDF